MKANMNMPVVAKENYLMKDEDLIRVLKILRDSETIVHLFKEFCEVENSGSDIEQAYRTAFSENMKDFKSLTALSAVMYAKASQHSEQNMELHQRYKDLFADIHQWCRTNLKGADLDYYKKTVR